MGRPKETELKSLKKMQKTDDLNINARAQSQILNGYKAKLALKKDPK